MTTRPPNHTDDPWSAATMAASVPQTVTMRAAAADSATTHYAWSAEPPESAVPQLAREPHHRFIRRRALSLIAGGLAVAASVGFFGALHARPSTTVDTATLTAAAPAVAPAAAPTSQAVSPPAVPAPTHVVHTMRTTTNHPAPTGHKTSNAVKRPSPPPQPQSNHDSVSTPRSWNHSFFSWFTHRHDHDGRWLHNFGHAK